MEPSSVLALGWTLAVTTRRRDACRQQHWFKLSINLGLFTDAPIYILQAGNPTLFVITGKLKVLGYLMHPKTSIPFPRFHEGLSCPTEVHQETP